MQAILVKREEYFENFCEVMICDFKVINILIRALKLSGWVFHMKVRRIAYHETKIISV